MFIANVLTVILCLCLLVFVVDTMRGKFWFAVALVLWTLNAVKYAPAEWLAGWLT